MLWRFAVFLSSLTVTAAFAPLAQQASRSTRSAASSSSTLFVENAGVVITGGAGGVGFAYAGEFLDRGYIVVICDIQDCSSAAMALESRHGASGAKIFHTKCDVSSVSDVEKLGKFAQKNLGTIGYWINNAGT